MYRRNRIYITPEEQERISKFHILFAGAGLGSVIAECALRLGFEHITIVDGDIVEESNLNRQNYTQQDMAKSKAGALKSRLLTINPLAKITAYHSYITNENAQRFLCRVDAVVNALDFTSNIPFEFDNLCVARSIPALHPYNLGWGSCVFVVTEESQNLSHISEKTQDFELQFVDYIMKQLTLQGEKMHNFQSLLESYKNEPEKLPPPQLAVASWITAGLCTDILFRLAVGREVKLFPEFYFKKI